LVLDEALKDRLFALLQGREVGLSLGFLESGRIVDVVDGDNVHDSSLHPLSSRKSMQFADDNTSANGCGNRRSRWIAVPAR
jgi:hypothetical protein